MFRRAGGAGSSPESGPAVRRAARAGARVAEVGREPPPGAPSDEELLRSLARWRAELRTGDAVKARSKERWLRQQAEEAATWTGTLVDLAESSETVGLLVGARTLTGRLVAVAGDFCVLVTTPGAVVVVSLGHLRAVRARAGRRPAATGERQAPLGVCFVDTLEILAGERSSVRLGLAGGETLGGRLEGVGVDVLSVRCPPGAGATGTARSPVVLHVPFSAVEWCSPTR